MRIGVDCSCIEEELKGVGNYLFFLLEELVDLRREDHFFLYTRKATQKLLPFMRFHNVTIRANNAFGCSQALWSQTTLSKMALKDDLDLFWGATQSLPLRRCAKKNMITLYDFAYRLYPKTVSFVRGLYMRLFARMFYKKADVIMAISQGTAKKLETLYGIKADSVIHPPLKKQLGPKNALLVQPTLEKYHLTFKNYLLLIATLEPRKNIQKTVETYAGFSSDKLMPLVLVGARGWRDKNILGAKNSSIFHLGYVEDDLLHDLICGAQYVICPSLYEGYGMPIAEARVCHTEVICSECEELTEAAEGDAHLLSKENFEKDLFTYATGGLLAKKEIKTHYFSNRELADKISLMIK